MPASTAGEMGRSQPLISIVVPTYCERENITALVKAVDVAMSICSWEIIFVDDNSPDGTADVIKSLAKSDGRIRCIRRVGRRGLAGAAIEGMLSSSADIVALMDCDMQHDEKILPLMIEDISNGADITIGTRYSEGGKADEGFSEPRKKISAYATWLTNKVLRTNVSDPMSGFFMMRRAFFESLSPRLSNDGFKILFDILASQPKSTKISEVAYGFRARHAGDSKLNGKVALEFCCQILAKLTGDRISPRFIMFMGVGGSGVLVHLIFLKAGLESFGFNFAFAQIAASYGAMTWNFFLNNFLTFSDRSHKGFWGLLVGLVKFYLVCTIGALANIGVAQAVYEADTQWWVAGIAGAFIAAVFNFAVSSAFAWRKS
jgi:dolichol-phosphate mannosyltransferase